MWDNKLRNIRILTIVTCLLVLATGVLSISSLRKLNDNLYWTLHTKDVLQLSDELYASILESESNLRGYSLSRNSSFISEYSLSKQQSLRLLDSLIDVTTDNEVQQQNIAVIRAPIISRIELLDSILALVRIHPSGADTVIADKVVRGKQITQTIKNQLAIINKTEYDLLQPRNKGLYFNLDMLPAILLFTTLTGLGAGALLIYSLFQYHLQKKETDKRISEYQQQLTEQIQRLNASNLELEQFAYVASHDLQEPLRKISAFSDLLRDQYKDAIVGDGELYLKRITTSALRMRELITDLLSYSRASRKTQAQFIDLNSILDMVKEDLEMLIREKTATITYSKLPVVAGNTSEFRQLFQNLIANSLKFSKPEIPANISISVTDPGWNELRHVFNYDESKKYIAIKVKDNGIGFDPEYADKIFIIFQRLHGKDSFDGTGIGLAICKKIVEKYDGAIFAESSNQNGATFTIVLPKSNGLYVAST